MSIGRYEKIPENYPLHANVANWLVPRVVKTLRYIDDTADADEPTAVAVSRYVRARCDTTRYRNATEADQGDARFFLRHAVADAESIFEYVLEDVSDREEALHIVHQPRTAASFAVLALRGAGEMRRIIDTTRDNAAGYFSLEGDNIGIDPGLDVPPGDRYCPFALPTRQGGPSQTFTNLLHFTGELLVAQKFGYNERDDRFTQCDRRVQGGSARRDSRSA